MPPLKSRKQEKFCLRYAETGNATQSFKDAGYKYNSDGSARVLAHRLVNNNANVKNRLQELSKKAEDNAIADIKEMQATLTKIIREELDEEQLLTVGTGDGYSKVEAKRKKAALKDRLRAIELLTKMQGGFVDNINLNANVGVQIIDDIQE